MKCSHASDLFDEYLHATISPADKQALTEHLKGCPSCQKQWEAYRFFFADAKIEEDFLVPSQLNAKIKYTINQAKNKKKVPFFQNRQILAYAAACSFLLVAGIWGNAHYQQLKTARTEQIGISAEQTDQTGMKEVQKASETPLPPPELANLTADTKYTASQAVAEQSVSKEANSKKELPAQDKAPVQDTESILIAQIPPQTQSVTERAAFGSNGGGASAAPETEENTVSFRAISEPMAASEEKIVTADTAPTVISEEADFTAPANVAEITLPMEFSEKILSHTTCTLISENYYQVEITKGELEALIGEAISCPEQTLSFRITFE